MIDYATQKFLRVRVLIDSGSLRMSLDILLDGCVISTK